MRSYHTLRDLFHAIATLTLAAAAVGASDGCGGSTTTASGGSDAGDRDGQANDGGGPGPDGGDAGRGDGGDGGVDRGPFTTNVCDGASYAPLEGVTLAPTKKPIDYLEICYEQEDLLRTDGGPIDPARATVNVAAKRGTPCATATDPAACNAALKDLRTQAGWRPASDGLVYPRFKYLAYTSGDDVGVVTSLADLRAFVAPAETAKDAALLATATDEYRIVCDGRNNALQTSAGWDVVAQSGSTCGAGTHLDEHVLGVASSDGAVTVKQTVRLQEGDPGCAVGRRPEGLAPGGYDDGTLGGWLAEVAHLEAASIAAFGRLSRELAAHGAPGRLVRAADSGRVDEVRHAAMMGELARRHGAEVREPDAGDLPIRSLFAIALENAVEGCVRETFGALVATFQARRASDARIRCIMHVIAADETKHAELSWDVAAWIEPRLTPDERAAIARAKAEAVADLATALATPLAADVHDRAGMPSPGEARRMIAELEGALWGSRARAA